MRACLKTLAFAPKAQREGSQTCNVWDQAPPASPALKTREDVLALLQSANLDLLDSRRCTSGYLLMAASRLNTGIFKQALSRLRLLSLLENKRTVFALCAFSLLATLAVFSGACQSREESTSTETSGIVIVNAPATGEVRRVLVSEGMSVNKDAPIIEISVRVEVPTAQQSPTEDPQALAARNIQASKTEVEAARAEVVRTEVEVQRLTPLVASGQATQAELDGARASYERAQQRFQKAQDSARAAQSGLISARQQSLNSSNAPATVPTEQTVVARATSSGKVTVVNARVGEHVVAGQPLATLRTD